MFSDCLYTLQQSRIDPSYFEIQKNAQVIQEIKVLFSIRDIPRGFHSLDEVFEWLAKMENSLAKKYAYRLLTLKSYSKAALLKKLEAKGFSFAVSNALVMDLERLGFLSDTVFFQGFVLKMARRGYGPLYIARKIREVGGNETHVRDFMDVSLRKEALSKALLKLKKKSGKQKAMALFQRGFDWSDCMSISYGCSGSRD